MKLYVGNLAFETTENDLQDLFEQHGTVNEVNLMRDRMTGKSRGFAFVEMAAPEGAQKAIAALNGYSLGERALTVNEARPKGSGGGERGSRGGGSQRERRGGGGFGRRDRY